MRTDYKALYNGLIELGVKTDPKGRVTIYQMNFKPLTITKKGRYNGKDSKSS